VQSSGTFGAVPYRYRIGKYEVTNAQYVEFLNSVDPTGADPLRLYDDSMSVSGNGGINFSSSAADGSKYSVKVGRESNPVNYVTWYDAIRFANWMHNGMGSGDTENGAYTLLGGTITPLNGSSITRNADAKWWLPSADEWYKAAYHKNDDVTGNYWDYPTSTDAVPYSDEPPGSDAPEPSNTANFRYNDGVANGYDDGFAVTGTNLQVEAQNYLTDVGAYTSAPSPYGTFDQGGNVWEWNDTRVGAVRGKGGGSWLDDTGILHASVQGNGSDPRNRGADGGFRLATVIPEPSTFLLLACAAGAALLVRARIRRPRFLINAAIVLTLAATPTIAHAATIETVPVGNPGNANDPATGHLYGAVSHAYNIGKYEVTVGQYTEFLNAVAASDTYALYNTSMATNLNIAGIARSGASGSYSYSVIGSPNHPVTYVSWGDAARFANWLHNGQPNGAQGPGTTETGAYTLNGATSSAALLAVTRVAGARWFIPTENEWYKAAYFQPAVQGGDSDSYWAYPMRTNSVPYSDQPPGATPDNTRVGNFYWDDGTANGYDDGFAVTGSTSQSSSQNYLTDVGVYTSSPTYYGTFDQGGNVYEWNETAVNTLSRGVRGGWWDDNSGSLRASYRQWRNPLVETFQLGFRMASIPEPGTLLLGALAGIGLLGLACRRSGRNQSSRHRKHIRFHEQATMLDAFRKVDAKNIDRRASHGRESTQVGTVPGKVRVPVVAARVKERRQRARFGIMAGDVDGLERVAAETTDAQILGGGGAVMVLRADMIDGKREWIEPGWHPAIFAQAAGACPHKLAKFAADDRHYSDERVLPRASRARACRMPMSVPTRRKPSISARSESVSKPWLLRSISSRIRSWSSRAKPSDSIASAFSGERMSRSMIADSLTALGDMPLSYRADDAKAREPSYKRGLLVATIVAAAVGVSAANHAQADMFGSGASTFDIDFVTIGNPGNPADTTGSPNPAGSVP
jgi:formylglycine-generating enzyme required for sulfatase activity